MKAHYESQGCTVTTTDVGSAFETDTLMAECPFNPAPYPDPTPDPAPLPTSPSTPDPDPDSCDAPPTSGAQAGSVAAIAASAVQDQTAGPRVWKCFSGGGFTSDFALSVALVKMAAWSTANLHHCLPTCSRTEESWDRGYGSRSWKPSACP